MAATTGSKPKLGTMKESGFYNDNSSLQNNAVQLVLPMLQEAAASAAKAYLSAPGGAAGQAGASRRVPFWVLELGCSQGGNSMQAVASVLQQLQAAAAAAGHRAHNPPTPTPQHTVADPAHAAAPSHYQQTAVDALDVVVVHEDLASNDFSSLLHLLNDPRVSYVHAANASTDTTDAVVQPGLGPFTNGQPPTGDTSHTGTAITTTTTATAAPHASISLPSLHIFPYIAGRCMYERLCPSGSLHVAFAFSAFHWLPGPPEDEEAELNRPMGQAALEPAGAGACPEHAHVGHHASQGPALETESDSDIEDAAQEVMRGNPATANNMPATATATANAETGSAKQPTRGLFAETGRPMGQRCSSSLLSSMAQPSVRDLWLLHAMRSWSGWLAHRAVEAAGPGAAVVLSVPVFQEPAAGPASAAELRACARMQEQACGSAAAISGSIDDPATTHGASAGPSVGLQEGGQGAGSGPAATSTEAVDIPAPADPAADPAPAEAAAGTSGMHMRLIDGVLRGMVEEGKIDGEELRAMRPSMFLPTADELRDVLEAADMSWRVRAFETVTVGHPAYSHYVHIKQQAAEQQQQAKKQQEAVASFKEVPGAAGTIGNASVGTEASTDTGTVAAAAVRGGSSQPAVLHEEEKECFDEAVLADVYCNWYRAVLEPSLLSGLMCVHTARMQQLGRHQQQGEKQGQQQQQDQQSEECKDEVGDAEAAVHAHAHGLVEEAFIRYKAALQSAPAPIAFHYVNVWLERV